jgi:trigger factor
MQINFSKNEQNLGTLTLELNQQDIAGEYRKRLTKASQTVQMKGFRPGKVPPALIEKMYGPSVKAEALSEIVNKTINDYISEEKLTFLGDIHPDHDNGNEELNSDTFHFKFEMALVPEVTLPDLASITVINYKVDFTREEALEQIENLRRRRGQVADDETVRDGSFLHVNFFIGEEPPVKSYLALERMKLEGRELFMGKQAGDSLNFNLEDVLEDKEIRMSLYKFDENEPTPAGPVRVELEKVQSLQPVPFDLEFAEQALNIEYDADER